MTQAFATDALVVYPTVNLNGSAGDALLDQLRHAIDAVETAQQALQHGAPHGRDYQIGPHRYEQAHAQHVARQAALARVRESLTAEVIAVFAQVDERRAQRR